MNIGIVTIAYNGYARFAPQWCKQISEVRGKFAQVTIAIGKDSGMTPEIRQECRRYLMKCEFVVDQKLSSMGALRNFAIEHTSTTWIMFLSIDDGILPSALEVLDKYEDGHDYICIRWLLRGLRKGDVEKIPKTPREMALRYQGRGFIVGHSPFRRSLWAARPYQPHDYPNAPFLSDCVEQGARFVVTDEPVSIYQRRPDSHSRTVLGRHRGPGKKRGGAVAEEIAKARYFKNDMKRRIIEYYSSENEK